MLRARVLLLVLAVALLCSGAALPAMAAERQDPAAVLAARQRLGQMLPPLQLVTASDVAKFMFPLDPRTAPTPILLLLRDAEDCKECESAERASQALQATIGSTRITVAKMNVGDEANMEALMELVRESPTLMPSFEPEVPSYLVGREGVIRPLGMGGSAKSLVAYLQTYDRSPLTNIDNKSKKTKWASASSKPRVIAYFEGKPSRKLLEQFESVGRVFQNEMNFAYVTDKKTARPFGLGKTSPALRVFAPYSKTVAVDMPTAMAEKFDAGQVLEWLHSVATEYMVSLSAGWSPEALSGTHPLLIAYINPSESRETSNVIGAIWDARSKHVNKKVNQQFMAVALDTVEFDTFAARHKVDLNALPEVHILDKDLVTKYVLPADDVNDPARIAAFMEGFAKGKLRPTYKSATEPTTNARSNLKEFVRSNFAQRTQDTGRDVVVEFYTGWCTHCKTLAPTYKLMANMYASDQGITIARYNLDDNDLPEGIEVKGFPTIMLFPATKAARPIQYKGRKLDFESLVTFIQANRKTSGPAPVLPEEKQHDEL